MFLDETAKQCLKTRKICRGVLSSISSPVFILKYEVGLANPLEYCVRVIIDLLFDKPALLLVWDEKAELDTLHNIGFTMYQIYFSLQK